MTHHGIFSGQMDSVFMVGRNVLNHSLCYTMNVDRVNKLEFSPHNMNTVASQVDLKVSALLLELLQYRDGSLPLPNNNFNNTKWLP